VRDAQRAQRTIPEVHVKWPFLSVLLALAFSPVCSGQFGYSGQVFRVSDAPFSAEVSGWNRSPDDFSGTWKNEIGRAADGSFYIAQTNPIPELKRGIPIGILDAATNCRIDVDPYHEFPATTSRGKTVQGSTGFDINLSMDRASSWPTRTVDDIRQGHVQLQRIFRRIPHTFDPDGAGDNDRTVLGEKMVNGMAIYGFRDERTHNSKTEWIEDRWESELGFRFSENRSNPDSGSSWGFHVTSLKQVEPPHEWFTIQQKYFPPTHTLTKAKTLFISEVHSHEELLQRIESILTASGRFTIVPNADAADVRIQTEVLDGKDISMSFRELGAHQQYIRDILTIYLRLDGTPNDWAESQVVNTLLRQSMAAGRRRANVPGFERQEILSILLPMRKLRTTTADPSAALRAASG
jgi:hypothetical protein